MSGTTDGIFFAVDDFFDLNPFDTPLLQVQNLARNGASSTPRLRTPSSRETQPAGQLDGKARGLPARQGVMLDSL